MVATTMNHALDARTSSASPSTPDAKHQAKDTDAKQNRLQMADGDMDGVTSTDNASDTPRPKIHRAPRALMVIEKKEQSPFDAHAAKQTDVKLGQWDFKFAASMVFLVVFINLSLTLLLGNSAKQYNGRPQEDITFQGQFGDSLNSNSSEGNEMYLHDGGKTSSTPEQAGNTASSQSAQEAQKLLSIINRY